MPRSSPPSRVCKRCATRVNAVAIIPEMTATEISSINAAKNNVNYEISTVNSKISSLQTQKSLNQNSISAAENSLTTAQNNLRVAETQLALKKAGYTNEQIKSQESAVKQAEANLKSQNAQIQFAQSSLSGSSAELAKNYLRSPIEGVVTEVNAKVGEIISMSSPAVKIISKAKFQIETDVPEADIAKIKAGDKATLDLDALGSDLKLNATVMMIDPAEKMLEGVPTYKVTLEFDENDERIRSGMTANLDILTAKAENAIYIPRRAVISESGKKFVQKYTNKEELKYEKFEIETGLSGSNGEIEILKGLTEGEEIIVFIEKTNGDLLN
jgi:HlyD family secretion protein